VLYATHRLVVDVLHAERQAFERGAHGSKLGIFEVQAVVVVALAFGMHAPNGEDHRAVWWLAYSLVHG